MSAKLHRAPKEDPEGCLGKEEADSCSRERFVVGDISFLLPLIL